MELIILSTSDIHGYMTSQQEDADEGQSYSRAASVIENERAQALDPVIYIDNGDFIDGSKLSDFYRENNLTVKSSKGRNALKPDASNLGNHEFSYGRDYLESIINSANHPFVCGNVTTNNNPMLAPAFETKTYGPVRVGILGLVTADVPNREPAEHVRGMNFVSALTSAKRWVPILKKQENCDVIIVAYHGGFECDLETGEPNGESPVENEGYALLNSGLPIDVLITGHQHEKVATIVNDIAVIQPGVKGEAVGKVVLELSRDEQNDIVVTPQSNELIDSISYPESSVITQLYEEDIKRSQAE